MGASKWESVEMAKRRFSYRSPQTRGTEYLLQHNDTQLQIFCHEDGDLFIAVYGEFNVRSVRIVPPDLRCPDSGLVFTPKVTLGLEPSSASIMRRSEMTELRERQRSARKMLAPAKRTSRGNQKPRPEKGRGSDG